jgi:tetratricopeptide (TPR) repeat protein
MRRLSTLSAALLAVGLALIGTGCSYLKARDHVNKGIAAYTQAKYSDAVEHFKQAMELDPDWPMPRLYLATAYMIQWIPGAESPETREMAERAKAEFLKVLEQSPQEKTALASLASLAYNEATTMQLTPEDKTKKLDEAAEWHAKRIQADPTEKEAYYSLGVISYARWAPVWLQARSNLKMKSEDPGPLKDKKIKEDLKQKYSSVIEEGIQNLEKALAIDPEYNEAMAYMNLLIRERADLLDDPEQYKKEIEVADNWLQKALDTARIKAQREASRSNGIVQDK